MISTQLILNCIEELHDITKVDFSVYDLEGIEIVSTCIDRPLSQNVITDFLNSSADSQTVGGVHLLKVYDDDAPSYAVLSMGDEETSFMMGRVAVSQLTQLQGASKERFDRNNFFQNLLMDNMLLVDVHNRAKKLHIEAVVPRIVYLIESSGENDTTVVELLKGMFSTQAGDYVTTIDENYVIVIKSLDAQSGVEEIEDIANSIVDTISAEAMINVRVAYGTVVQEIKDVSKTYKEAMMALDVGKIFYAEKKVTAYEKLGIGRLIYQLPVNLCKIFVDEIFGENDPADFDEEIVYTANKFFENDLNVSETSRQLFIHRNTLIYRIEKLKAVTGLDVRSFDDALTFKICMMVYNYMNYLNSHK